MSELPPHVNGSDVPNDLLNIHANIAISIQDPALPESLSQGITQVQQEDYAAALQSLNYLLEDRGFEARQLSDGHRIMGLYYRGLARTHSNDWQGAVADYLNALAMSDQNNAYYPKLQFALGMAWVALGDHLRALPIMKALTDADAHNAAAQQLLAMIYKNLWRTGSSETNSYLQASYLTGAITAYKQAASAFLAQGDELNCRRCIEAYQELQTSLPPTPQGLLDSAAQKLKERDWLGALIDLNWVVQMTADTDPLKARGMALRGVVHSKLKDLASAMQDLNQAFLLSPHDVEVRLTRGVIRSEMGDTQGAIADFTALLREQPSLPQVYISRGLAYHKQRDYRQAIEDFSRGLSLEQQPQWYCDRGQARYDFGDIRGAIDDYQQAANLWFNQSPIKASNMVLYQKAIDRIKFWQPELARQERTIARQQEQATASLVNNPNQMPSLDLQERLLRLVGGNMAIAQRLLDIAKQDQPNMPEEWYWKKVIFDLESTMPEE